MTPVTSFPTIYFPRLSLQSLSLLIDKVHVDLDKMRIVNCMFLLSAKFDIKKCL